MLASVYVTLRHTASGAVDDVCAEICNGVEAPDQCLDYCITRLDRLTLLENEGPHEENPHKRLSSFVRIGRGMEDEKRASSFVRIGKDVGTYEENPYEDKRASSFVRIGKSMDEPQLYELQEDPLNKRASQFVRIGRGPYKRLSSFVRIGKRRAPSSFVRIGKKSTDMGDAYIPVELPDPTEKRASHFVRIGKSVAEEEEEKRASAFVRIGKALAEEQAKRASAFVRIGKAAPSQAELLKIMQGGPGIDNDKRASSFVRIGKSSGDVYTDAQGLEPMTEEEKRASSFVRIGRSSQELSVAPEATSQ